VLAVLPVLTLPISVAILGSVPECEGDEPWWDIGYFELALLPGLADLLPFAWLRSGTPGVRRAAVIAGLIGAVRFAVPQALTLLDHASTGGGGCTISVFFAAGMLAPTMLALWLASAVISAVIVRRARKAPATGG
jgi:hypothetical protein